MNKITWKYERSFLKSGCSRIVGIDEAGRGPLAGPVVAAAVVFALDKKLPRDFYGADDSKQLSESRREELFASITQEASAIGIGIVSPQEIDDVNILQATMRAMTNAVNAIAEKMVPEILLVDGNYFRTTLNYPFKTIIDGDTLSPSIAAASIIAKVTRDRIMKDLHNQYPEYNFHRNKGYGTKEHREAIERVGYCPIHRKSFKLKSKGV